MFKKRNSSFHNFSQVSDASQKPSDSLVTRAPAPQLGVKVQKLCFFCHKPGHLTLKRKQQAAASKQPIGVGLIKTDSL